MITFNHDAMMNPGFLVEVMDPSFSEEIQWIVYSNSRSASIGNLSIEIEGVWGFEYIVLTVIKSPLTLLIEILLLKVWTN